MELRRRLLIGTGVATVLVVAAVQLRSELAKSFAYQPETLVSWGEEFLDDTSVSAILAGHTGDYPVSLADRFGEVYYLGLRTDVPHTPHDEMLISRKVSRLRPTVYVFDPVLGTGLETRLAKSGSRVEHFSLTEREERDVFVARFGTPESSMYLALRDYARAKSAGTVHPLDAEDFVRAHQKRLDLQWQGGAIDEFDTYWERRYPGLGDWRYITERVLEENRKYGVLSELAAFEKNVRDMNMVKQIAALVQKGERVFAVTGRRNVVRQEPVLRMSLGLPPTVPLYEEDHGEGLTEKANHIQPVMKHAPPTGVTAPSQVNPVIDKK